MVGTMLIAHQGVTKAPARVRAGARMDNRSSLLFVHRFGDSLNSHVHFHVLVTDGVFSAAPDDPEKAVFHLATELDEKAIRIVRDQLRHRGLRWLVRHEHLDQAAATEMLTWQHGGGWSIDASVRVAEWDRQGLERLVRYCARPPLASGRLGRLNEDTLVYRLRRPLLDGRTEILLRPVDLLARLVDLLTPPRKHRHRYCGGAMRIIAFILEREAIARILGTEGDQTAG